MKKVLLFLSWLCVAEFISAQDTSKTKVASKKGVAFELALNGCFGAASNNSGDADLSNLAYESLSFSEGSQDSIGYKIGGGVNAGFEMNLLFGKNRNVGFGVGFHFTAGFNSFSSTDFTAEYKAQDREGRFFKRVLSASDWSEKVTYTNLSLPVLFKYRTMFGKKKKMGFFTDLGPVFVLLSSAKTKQEASLNFEAVYSLAEGEPGYSPETESTDWLITREAIEEHLSEGGTYSNVHNYFEQQYSCGYYVGLDNNATGDPTTINYKVGYGGLIRMGILYQISPVLSFTVGAQCMVVSSERKTSVAYQAVEVADDFKNGTRLNTLLNSTGSLLTAQYGVSIGVQFRVVK